MIIGITGSIGSGKTTIAKLFSKYHFNRIAADEIAHKLIRKNTKTYKKIIMAFGDGILDKNKNIDRKKLGNIVFNDGRKLKKLNSIMHPMIFKNIKNEILETQKKCGSKIKIIIDAPLLLETKTKKLVGRIIVVKSDKKNVLKRLSKKYPKYKIEKILNSQMKPDEKLKYADFVIDNNGDLKHLGNQVKKIAEILSEI